MPSTLNYRSLIGVGICLPAALAVSDYAILASVETTRLSPQTTVAVMGYFVLQVAVVSWAVPRFITPWPMQWLLWIWTMVLIDLQLAAMSGDEGYPGDRIIDGLSVAIIAGQLGSIIVWGALGGGALRWRVVSLLVLAFVGFKTYGVMLRIARPPEAGAWGGWWFEARLGWNDLLVLEMMMLGCLCLVIRLCGFQLAIASSAEPQEPKSKQPIQFGIRHVLIGTTVLAAVLGLAKAGDMLTAKFGQQLVDESFLFVASVVAGTVAVLLVALWASLGRGNVVFRVALAIALPLAIGAAVAAYCVVIGQPQLLFGFNTRYWMYQWYQTGYWWIAYMALTALLLAASLIIFRTRGYRLIHNEGGLRNALTIRPRATE